MQMFVCDQHNAVLGEPCLFYGKHGSQRMYMSGIEI